MDKAEKFDPWWKTHSHLFEEKFVVREIARHTDRIVGGLR
jgi:hypothetical protein